MFKDTKSIHFTYIVAILIAIIILLITEQTIGRPDIINLISVATGLVSLVLGLIAIIFAFVSNGSVASLGSVSSRLENSSKSIETSVESTVLAIAKLKDEISPALLSVDKKVLSVDKKLQELLDKSNPSMSSEASIKPHAEVVKVLEAIIDYFLTYTSWYGLIVLDLSKKAYDQKIEFSLEEWAKFNGRINSDYALGYFVCASSIGLISNSLNGADKAQLVYSVTEFVSKLPEKLNRRIEEQIEKSTASEAEIRRGELVKNSEFVKSKIKKA